MEQKPGRYWGVIGRQHLPVGFEQEEIRQWSFSVLCSLRALLFKMPASVATKGIEPRMAGLHGSAKAEKTDR